MKLKGVLGAEKESDIFTSVSSLLMEQRLPVDVAVLAINLLSVSYRPSEDGSNVANIILGKLGSLLTTPCDNSLLRTAILELMNRVVRAGESELLAQMELVDVVLSFLSRIESDKLVTYEDAKLITACLTFVQQWCHIEKDLTKYLLTSTRLLPQLLTIITLPINNKQAFGLYEAMARCWLTLTHPEEDLFIYKLSQLMSNQPKALMDTMIVPL